MPPTGSQPVRAAGETRKSDIDSGGMDSSRSDAVRMAPVRTPPGGCP